MVCVQLMKSSTDSQKVIISIIDSLSSKIPLSYENEEIEKSETGKLIK